MGNDSRGNGDVVFELVGAWQSQDALRVSRPVQVHSLSRRGVGDNSGVIGAKGAADVSEAFAVNGMTGNCGGGWDV